MTTRHRLFRLLAPLGAVTLLTTANGAAFADQITNVTSTTYDVTVASQPINHYETKTIEYSCPSGGVAHDNLDDPMVTNLSSFGVSMVAAYVGPSKSASISFTNWASGIPYASNERYSFRVVCDGAPPSPAPAQQPASGKITVDATTADGHPYVAGSVANQKVLVSFTCASAPTPFLMTGGSFGDGKNQFISSGGGCTDSAGNAVAAINFGPINVDTGAQPAKVNDSDSAIRYIGTGWGYYGTRGVGDMNDDVHATINDGDSASYTFGGTGITYITERSADEGKVDVAIDGVLQQTVDASSAGHNVANQALYSVWGLPQGKHTITLTKRGGGYMLLDGFVVQTAGNTINDTDPSVHYTGNWTHYGARPAASDDVQQDVHATPNNGDTVAYIFNGTGVAYVTERSADEGQVDIYLDSVFQQTVDAGAPDLHNQGGQVLFSKTGLPIGQHTLTMVKKSGTWMLLDAITVLP